MKLIDVNALHQTISERFNYKWNHTDRTDWSTTEICTAINSQRVISAIPMDWIRHYADQADPKQKYAIELLIANWYIYEYEMEKEKDNG